MAKTIIFVETSAQVDWAVKYFEERRTSNFSQFVFAPLPEAQYALKVRGLAYEHYLSNLPKPDKVEQFVNIANNFALNWYKNSPLMDVLQFEGVDLGHYFIAYWTNLLIPLLTSHFVIDKIINKYHPKEIIYFENLIKPESRLNADSFYLEELGRKLYPKIHFHKQRIASSALTSAVKYKNGFSFRWFLEQNTLALMALAKIAIRQKIFFPVFGYKKSAVLYYADKYILVKSLPLVEHLKSKFTMTVATSLLSLANRIELDRNNIGYIDFGLITKPDVNREYIGRLRDVWYRFSKSSDYRKLLRLFNLESFAPIINQATKNYIHDHIGNCLVTLAQVRHIVRKVGPKVILLPGNYGKRGLSLAYAGKEIGAKVILWEHGITSAPRQAHPPVFDKMLVWGNFTKRLYYKYLKVPLVNMIPVGWFYIDNDIGKLGKGPSRRKPIAEPITILFTMSFYLPDYPKELKIITDILNLLATDGRKFVFIARPHEGESFPADISAVVPKSENIVFKWDLGETDLDSQLRQSDIILSQGTTPGLRAMLRGKPVIHLLTQDVTDTTEFHKYGAAIKVTHISQLLPAIKKIVAGKSRQKMISGQRKLLRDYCYKLDGKASSRVASYISKYLRR